MAGAISANTSKRLSKEINVNAPYAAYVEFGTGKYAAKHVASLPDDWRSFAAQFKDGTGKKNPSAEMVKRIAEWIRRHGGVKRGRYRGKGKAITATKGGRNFKFTIATKSQNVEKITMQAAYALSKKILRDGIRPRSYLLKAVLEQQPKMLSDFDNLIKSL